MRILILLALLALAACSEERPAQVTSAGVRTETFSVEAGLIDELVAAQREKTATDKANFEANSRFYAVAAKLRSHGLRYETEGYGFRGEEHIKRVYRVASEDVVVFYSE